MYFLNVTSLHQFLSTFCCLSKFYAFKANYLVSDQGNPHYESQSNENKRRDTIRVTQIRTFGTNSRCPLGHPGLQHEVINKHDSK